MLNQSVGSVVISNCAATSNNAITGGGISNHGALQIDQSTVSNNSVTPNDTNLFPTVQGGGVYNSGTLTITSSTIANNEVVCGSGPPEAYGAGIYNVGTMTLINCTIAGDRTFKGVGGGIYNDGPSVQVTNCTISNNLVTLVSGESLIHRERRQLSSPTISLPAITLPEITAGVLLPRVTT